MRVFVGIMMSLETLRLFCCGFERISKDRKGGVQYCTHDVIEWNGSLTDLTVRRRGSFILLVLNLCHMSLGVDI